MIEHAREARLDRALHHEATDQTCTHHWQHTAILLFLGKSIGDTELHYRDVVGITQLDHHMPLWGVLHATSHGEHSPRSLGISLIGVKALGQDNDGEGDGRSDELKVIGVDRGAATRDELAAPPILHVVNQELIH